MSKAIYSLDCRHVGLYGKVLKQGHTRIIFCLIITFAVDYFYPLWFIGSMQASLHKYPSSFALNLVVCDLGSLLSLSHHSFAFHDEILRST